MKQWIGGTDHSDDDNAAGLGGGGAYAAKVYDSGEPLLVAAVTVHVSLSELSIGTVQVAVGTGTHLVATSDPVQVVGGFDGWLTLPLTADLRLNAPPKGPIEVIGDQLAVAAAVSGSARLGHDGSTAGLLVTAGIQGPEGLSLAGIAGPIPAVFALTQTPWVPPALPDEELAAYGWDTAQQVLVGQVESGSRLATTVEWHHTSVEDHQGSFALVREGGPLEELVGDVLKVTRGSRSVHVYVIDASDELDAELSLARRAFLGLASLSVDDIQATVEVTSAAGS